MNWNQMLLGPHSHNHLSLWNTAMDKSQIILASSYIKQWCGENALANFINQVNVHI